MKNWTIFATVALCAAVVAGAAGITEYGRYGETVAVAERDTRIAAGLAAAHAAQTFAEVKSTLRGVDSIRNDVAEDRIRDAETTRQLLDSLRGDGVVIRSLGWTDERGLQQARSSNGALGPLPADMGNREHFLFHREHPDGWAARELHLSAPIRARATGDWLVIASIPLIDGKGRFAGVAGAALDPLYFASIYRRIELGESRIATLYREDGIVLSRSPDAPAWIGDQSARADPPFRDKMAGNAGTYREGDGESQDRIVSFRKVPNLPLVVTVSLSYADALAPFYRSLRVSLSAVGLTLILLAGAGWSVTQWIGERRQSRVALEQSEERYRALSELSPVGVFRTDAEGRCVYVNDRWCDHAGLTAAEILGKAWTDALHPEDYARVRDEWSQCAQRRETFSSEFRFETPSGRVTWLVGQSAPVRDGRGRIAGHIGTATDITERKRQEDALRDSEDRFRTLVNTIDGIVWEADARTLDFTFISEKAERFLGYPSAAWLGPGFWAEHVHPDDRDLAVARRIEATARRQGLDFEYRFLAGDGRTVWLHDLSAVAVEGGWPRWLRGIMVDVSKYKQAEEALRRSQKMEAIGLLTGGIAHDFNNLLNVILSHAELLEEIAPANPDVSRSIEAMTKSVRRGADLTRKLLSFSRTQPQATKRVSVNAFIESMKGLIAKSLTPAIRVKAVLAGDAWPVDIDPGDLEDAVLNLALNARDAMPRGGSLIIETSNKVIDEVYVERNPGSRAGDFVMLSVSDTGTGMTPEVREKAFEPFFTTKGADKGTGLGLSMVYGFVQRSGGHAKIYSEEGQGTAVHLYLPRARETGAAVEAASGGFETLPRGSETILVVDDEPSLVEAAVHLLGRLGYRTLTADSAVQALAVLSKAPAVDLLFSDVIMPGGMDGYRLAIEALARRPGLKVLLTSGFTRQREEFVNGEGKIAQHLTQTLLGKPYNIAELATAVRKALDGA
ncbi:PAS domain S-box protein [Shumkonia mesophila]|uniref:PAS domain S-box protein n=1 Tax=Shumkonia mesophila TaxID=2838854 RepID=UPI0029350AD6|nr:PAS domain S-box protein [Shumkonia mesophila]